MIRFEEIAEMPVLRKADFGEFIGETPLDETVILSYSIFLVEESEMSCYDD